MLCKLLFLISWFTTAISDEHSIPIQLDNVTPHDKSDETFHASILRWTGKGRLAIWSISESRNSTIACWIRKSKSGSGKEGLPFGQLLDHIPQPLLAELEKVSKTVAEKS
ncbi:unnamed protein product [Cercopithifilaria johnstoni]|uniref:Uncharacterized protein n=1 Tax=Cercopithifilaria johnstoni TaxID=2874296 RepID=A0A8J2Q4U8_9BILA|nr:unnamed protein product [Cercopithifilaria johnstoni]